VIKEYESFFRYLIIQKGFSNVWFIQSAKYNNTLWFKKESYLLIEIFIIKLNHENFNKQISLLFYASYFVGIVPNRNRCKQNSFNRILNICTPLLMIVLIRATMNNENENRMMMQNKQCWKYGMMETLKWQLTCPWWVQYDKTSDEGSNI
jgi:hypothetical protein